MASIPSARMCHLSGLKATQALPRLEACFQPVHAAAAAAKCNYPERLNDILWIVTIPTQGEEARKCGRQHRDLTRRARVIRKTPYPIFICTFLLFPAKFWYWVLSGDLLIFDSSKCGILIIISRWTCSIVPPRLRTICGIAGLHNKRKNIKWQTCELWADGTWIIFPENWSWCSYIITEVWLSSNKSLSRLEAYKSYDK